MLNLNLNRNAVFPGIVSFAGYVSSTLACDSQNIAYTTVPRSLLVELYTYLWNVIMAFIHEIENRELSRLTIFKISPNKNQPILYQYYLIFITLQTVYNFMDGAFLENSQIRVQDYTVQF